MDLSDTAMTAARYGALGLAGPWLQKQIEQLLGQVVPQLALWLDGSPTRSAVGHAITLGLSLYILDSLMRALQ